MKNLRNFLLAGTSALALTLAGCPSNTNYSQKEKPKEEKVIPDYFAEVPMYSQSGLTITTGDFDKDGNLDLIVGAQSNGPNVARLYFFKGDGKGHFSLVKPEN